jgi:hypothetical protein
MKNKPIINTKKTRNQSIDQMEVFMIENLELVDFPLTHRFSDGVYVREISVPKGVLLTSKVLKTQHQFFLMKGALSMWNDGGQETYMEAPFIGFTEANTRRVVYVHEDCVFATVHPNPKNEPLDKVEERIIDKYDNPLLTEEMKNKVKSLQDSVRGKDSKLIKN